MHLIRKLMAACALLLTFAVSTGAHAQTRVFDLHNRPASQLVKELHSLYPGNQVQIVSHGQQLVVRASPEDIEEIARLVKRLDVPSHEIRITVRKMPQTQNNQGGRTYSTEQTTSQSVVVADGQGAHVSAGSIQRVPVAVRGGRNPTAVLKSVNYQHGFVVRPQFISKHQVELHIIAFDNQPNASNNGAQDSAVVTIRRVQPGHWVPLGGTDKKQAQGPKGGANWHAGPKQDDRYEVRVEVVR